MKIIDDGIIKYDKSGFTQTAALSEHEYKAVEQWRKKLKELNLISAYPETNVGYGNISQRRDYTLYCAEAKAQFIITGTQTGHLQNLNGNHYTRVIKFDIDNFSINAMGPIDASSEALTHAAIYELNPAISAVIHIHNEIIWNGLIKNKESSTSKFIPYGTKEMALAVKTCLSQTTYNHFVKNGYYDGKTQGIFVMKGHKEGVVAYGPNLTTAAHLILKAYARFVDSSITF